MSNCGYVTMNKAGTLCWGKSNLGKSAPNTDRKTYVKPAEAFAKAKAEADAAAAVAAATAATGKAVTIMSSGWK
jgi:hypothetical protein